MKRWLSMLLVMAMILSCIPVIPLQVTASETEDVRLELSDTYGDGWNGNKIAVYIDGVFSEEYTFSSGKESSFVVSYDSTKDYEFRWVRGNYSYECYFSIYMTDGMLLFSATTTDCSTFTDGQAVYLLEGSGYDLEGEFAGGSGTVTDPYLIATKAQLNNVRNHLAAHFRQVNHIAFTASDFTPGGDFYNDGYGWEPIGTSNNGFYGSYDGNGYSISGLTITGSAEPNIGLFGYFGGSVVNLNMWNLAYTITGSADENIGGIVGYDIYGQSEIVGCSASGIIQAESADVGGIIGHGGLVKFCTSNVSITVTDVSYSQTGGIAGYAYRINHCQNNGNILVSGGQATVGGIVGSTGSAAITDCKNTGSVSAESAAEYDTICVGGIAGEAYASITRCENTGAIAGAGYYTEVGGIAGAFSNYSTASAISECVNKGTVSAAVTSGTNVIQQGAAGGIVGSLSYGSVRNCYTTSTGIPTSKGKGSAYAGGIVGEVYSEGTVADCYSVISTVTVNTSASGWGRGGIIGYNAGTVNNCYYYYTYGVGSNKGTGSVSRVSSLSSFANQSLYYNFDFSNTWEMGTGSYTYAVLRMEKGHSHSLVYNAATVTYEASGELEYWYCASCDTRFRNAGGTRYVTEDMLKSDPLPRTGTCGTNVNWVLTYEGVLTVSGTGNMADYTAGTAPWYAHRDKVKTLVIENGVTGIGSYAFADCTNLTSVKISDGITGIGKYAFSGCSAVTQLILPESVTDIGDGAFAQITNIILCFTGDAPDFAGENVFSGTTASAYYIAGNQTWTQEHKQAYGGTVTWSGVASADELIVASGSMSYDKSWKLSVTGILTVEGQYSSCEIPDYSYSANTPWKAYKDQVKALVLKNISRVGDYTFTGYTALEKVDLGSAYEIGLSAFEDCKALKKVFIAGAYSSTYTVQIEKYAFYGCSALQEVATQSRTVIGEQAFGQCRALKDIYITNYGTYNIMGEYRLQPSNNSFTGVTATVHLLKDWTVPTNANYGGTLNWVRSDFGPCGADLWWSYDEATATITITGSGKMMAKSSGSECPWYSLRTNAQHLVIGDGVTDIPSYTFEYMSSIQTVQLPGTLKTLSCNAFNDCRSLNNLMIPASVTGFEAGCYFNRCDALTDVYYMGTAEEWAQVDNNFLVGSDNDNIENIKFLVLHEDPATCTESGTQSYYAFEDNSVYSDMYDTNKNVITTLQTIPATGHNYENGICTGCSEVKALGKGACGDDLTWILTEDGTLTISGTGAMYAFSSESAPWYALRDSVITVVLGEGVSDVDYNATSCCTKLTGILADENNAVYSSDSYGVLYNKAGTILILAPDGITGAYSIPDGVTGIEAGAFRDCAGLTSITIPTSVTSIGWEAFQGCSGLERVTIPGSVQEIQDFTFKDCTGLTEVEISEGITSIGLGSFFGCTGLTGITLPDSMERVGSASFSDCSNLTDVNLGNGVSVIGDAAFSRCTSLVSITIPESVTQMYSMVFSNCTGLISITIPESITSIEEFTFAGCTALTDVYYSGTKTQWNAIAIDNNEGGNEALLNATIHCKMPVVHCYEENGEEIAVGYDTLEGALAAATCGTVMLQEDVTVATVMLKPGITFDLNGYTLTAEYLVVASGATVLDGGTQCAGGGKLKVAEKNLGFIRENGQGVIPVWNGNDGYLFTKVTFQQVAYPAGSGAAQYMFLPSFSNAEVSALLADGCGDNGLKIQACMTWNNGQTQQFYTYSEELVQKVFDGTNQWVFDLKVTGIANITDMVASAVVVTDSGVRTTSTHTALIGG